MFFSNKKKFIFIIGDEGTTLLLSNKRKIEQRLFASSIGKLETKNFDKILEENPKAPVYVLLDTAEQDYNHRSLPGVSSIGIRLLIDNKLEREFGETEIRGAKIISRESTGRKDWNCLFVSSPVTNVIYQWLNYIMARPNVMKPVCALPIESEDFASTLLNKTFSNSKNSWGIVVTYNKTGGFRQLVIHKGQLVFTRLVSHSNEIPEIIAGNIEQEIYNTLDFLRRLGYDDDKINISAILPPEIAPLVAKTKIKGSPVASLTPFEAAKIFNMKRFVSPTDKFSDVLLAAHFVRGRPKLPLYNKKLKELNKFQAFNNIAIGAMFVVCAVFTAHTIHSLSQIYKTVKDTSNYKNQRMKIEERWTNAKDNSNYNIAEAKKITDFATLHKAFEENRASPFETIQTVLELQKKYAYTTSFSWKYEENKKDFKKAGNIESNIALQFYNTGNNLEDLFKNFDSFSDNAKTAFDIYKVSQSKLPEKMSLDEQDQPIEIQLSISSKKSRR